MERPGRWIVGLHVLVLAVLTGLQLVLPPFHHAMFARILTLATYAIGYNVLLGYVGLMSLGHAMFFGAGMYATGLTVYYLGFQAGEAFAAGLLASALVSVAVGLVGLRATGVAFLIVTMMFAQAFHLATLYFNEITLGDQGFILSGRLEPIRLGGLRLSFAEAPVKYNVALSVFATALLASLWLTRSPLGRVLVAVRENEERTRLLGYNTFAYKLLALVVSGVISGAAGSTYTLLFSYVGSSFVSTLYSIYPLLWTLSGGVGTTMGPLVGTVLMTYLVDVASGFTSSYLFVVGAVLVVLVLWAPTGIVGGIRARWAGWLP
jgi:branched-chain amino acid transport system permease protein